MEEIAVIWTETTKKQLQEIYLYTAEESYYRQTRFSINLFNLLRGYPIILKNTRWINTRLATTEITGHTNYSITGFRTE